MEEGKFDINTFKWNKTQLGLRRKKLFQEWTKQKHLFLENEIKYCLAPPINPTFDFGSNSPMKKLILIIVLQFIDSSSWSFRKKAMVGKYVTFDAMNEEEFRNKIRSSIQVKELSEKDLESNIETLINKLEQMRKRKKRKNMEEAEQFVASQVSMDESSQQSNISEEKSNNDELEEEEEEEEEELELSQDSDVLVDILDGTEREKDALIYNKDREYEFLVANDDEKDNLKKLLTEANNKQIDWSKIIQLEDDEMDDAQEVQNNDDYFKQKTVIRRDIWASANYKLFKWTTIEGEEYRCFTPAKSIPNIVEEINTFIKEWGIWSKAFDADNKAQLEEYQKQKKKHDADNARRPKRKYKWVPKNIETDMFYAINWTSDFGMVFFFLII